MEGYMTIGELSDILGIEKSTLRYWDQSGLIDLKRNNENNYREYSKNAVIEISDIAFYRSINIPIKKLKTINAMTSDEIDTTLAEVESSISREIEELVAKRSAVQRRRNYIKEYYELLAHPYQKKEPDMEYVVQFDFHNKEIWSQCLYDPYRYGICYDHQTGRLISSYTVDSREELGNEERMVLWKKDSDKNREYVCCVVGLASNSYHDNSLSKHIAYLEEQGYQIGSIVGRYLFTGFDTKKYDYHKIWFEIRS